MIRNHWTRKTTWLLALMFFIPNLGLKPLQILPSAGAEVLPWPWGSECPFPWTRIEGSWVANTSGGAQRFDFLIVGSLSNGTVQLMVKWYDSFGNMIGQGEGLAPKTERIVRAALAGMGAEESNSYWAFVRTYMAKKGKKTCAKNQQVTVLTLRPADGKGDERHFILEKLEENTRRR